MRDNNALITQNQDALVKEIMKEYWLKTLRGDLTKTTLPVFAGIKNFERDEKERKVLEYRFPDDVYSQIMQICNQSAMAFFIFLTAALNAVLHRYSRNESIIIGTTNFKIKEEYAEDNILILKNRVSGNLSFKELLVGVKKVVLGAYKNQTYPFEKIKGWLRVNRKVDVWEFLNIAFVSEQLQTQLECLKEFGLVIRCCQCKQKEQNRFKFEYNPNMYYDIIVHQFAGHLTNFLSHVLEALETSLEEIEILSEEEKYTLLHSFNNTGVKFGMSFAARRYGKYRRDKTKTIQELFEQQVERSPDGVAITCSEQLQVTYDELNKRANQLAWKLREKGVKPGTIVALMLDPSVEMVFGMLAALKSGGVYLPIDPGYPANRKQYMVRDSGATLILVNRHLVEEEQNKNKEVLQDFTTEVGDGVIIINEDSPYVGGNTNPSVVNGSGDPVYINYTSGTTGNPKGVVVSHGNVTAYLDSFFNEFDIGQGDTVLQQASYSFDVIVEELYPVLIRGGKLAIPGDTVKADIDVLVEFMVDRDVTFITCSPIMLGELNKRLLQYKNRMHIHTFISGGDVLRKSYIDNLLEIGNVYNTYGPTETTVCATYYQCDAGKGIPSSISIGKPILNSRIYIVDARSSLVPIGVAGELCISGESVSIGYLNHPEFTAGKFDQDLWDFQDCHDEKKKNNKKFLLGSRGRFFQKGPPGRRRLYKTGDLARWHPDGNLSFLGRIDFQVKIRGYRVELEEIECRLCSHPSVNEAVVLARENDSGDKYLCAYVVYDEGLKDKEIDLRDWLSRILPDYMIPSSIVEAVHGHIPRTSTGKVDRKSLLEIESRRVETAHIAPTNEVEEKLTEIWAELLNLDKKDIGINRDFFALGGHSFRATVMISKIHKTFEVLVPLVEIFKKLTVKGLAEYINASSKDKYFSLEAAEEKEYYELSSAQRRLYYLQQLEVESTVYNIPYMEVLDGDAGIDREKLEQTFKKLIRRHETLRTSFYLVDGRPVQRVREMIDFEIEYNTANITGNFVRPFDLANAPLMRAGLITTQDCPVLMVDMHHIIADGISSMLLVKDFIALYNGEELPGLRLQYKDYARWQILEKERGPLESQEDYWLKQLEGDIPVLNLPIDYPRPEFQQFSGDTVGFELGNEETAVLQQLAYKEGATLYMVLLGLYTVLLSKITGQENIVVGTPTSGRRHADLEDIIGMFVNTLVLRNYPGGEKSFVAFLEELKKNTLGAFENQDYPFEDLVEILSVERDRARNPIFDVMFNWWTPAGTAAGTNRHINSAEGESNAAREAGIYEPEHKIAKFDITLNGIERNETIAFAFEYCTAVYKKDTIERFIGYFKRIVESVVNDPFRKISGIHIISEEEKDKILYDFNKTEAEYSADETIHQLFEEQAEKSGDSAAVICWGQGGCGASHLSYGELNRKSNQLARLLRKKGIQADTVVSLMVERSLEMIVGLYAILKSGAAYLPIQPDYPEGRIRYMLADSGSRFLLTRERFADNINVDIGAEIFNLENESLYQGESGNLQEISTPGNLLYMIYTSGSTGKPKGVAVKILGFVNLLHWYVTEFGIDSRDCVLLIAPISFDLAQKNLYASLIRGGTLCLASPGLPDYHELSDTIAREQVTVVNSTPSMFSPLIEYNSADNYSRLRSLRYLFLGGEPIQGDKLAHWLNGETCRCELVNTYGPTECTDIASSFRVDKKNIGKQKNIPIGKPIYNVRLFVLDSYLQVVPIGVIGELCIGGIGLSGGYHKNPELTMARFIQTPHLPVKEVYRTGDLVRWLADGNILFFGRIDHQVKIRGFRIELGEIEAKLLTHEKIKEAVVVARKSDANNACLCAYVVPPSLEIEKEINIAELKEYLAGELPDYMVPSSFVQLEKIPLTPSGKINRKALPEPETGVVVPEYAAPGNFEEENLVEIWSKILRREKKFINVNVNFFELGGHSLSAISMIAVIQKKMAVKVPLRQLLKNPTIRHLTRYIKKAEKERHASIQPVEEKEYYDLSYAQRRLWVLCQLEEDSTAYNVPGAFILSGPLDFATFRSAARALVERHESLRTIFPLVDGEPKQRISKDFQINVEDVDLRDFDEPERGEKAREMFREYANRALDLEHGPLLLIMLVRLGEKKYLLIFNIHHIIDDGWSEGIIESEFIHLYNRFLKGEGNPLTPLSLQYKDYTLWNNELLRQDGFETIEGYWLEKFRDKPNGIELPLDHPRRPVQTFNGRRVNFIIEGETFLQLRRLCLGQPGSEDDNQATSFMGLLTLVAVLLFKYSGQSDIIIGSPIVGRRREELHPLVGFLANTLVYRTDVNPEKSFKLLLGRVREETLASYENQDYPFDMLVERLELDRDLSQSPLFNVMLAHNNTDTRDIDLEMADVEISPYLHVDDVNMSKFDLLFFMDETADQIYIRLEYNSDLFEAGTVERMADNFLTLTRSVIRNPEQPVWGLTYIEPSEYQSIVHGFNDYEEEFPSLTVQELFEKQAAKTPDHVAIVGNWYSTLAVGNEERIEESAHVTYMELNRNANQLAHYLREEFSVTPGDIIGIAMDRSLEMIIALLGIIKSGAVYMALDPAYPEIRISYMLADSHTKLVIAVQFRPELFSGYKGRVVDIRSDWHTIILKSPGNPDRINRLTDVLYVTYTSGSTGVPNGALVSHHMLTNLIQWQKEKTTIDGSLRCLQFTSINFDVSFQEIMSTLTAGGELFLIGETERKDIEYLMDFLRIHGIEVLYLPFYYLNFLFSEGGWEESAGHNLKHIVTAGEQLIMTHGLKGFLELNPEVRLHNHYGPAEMHVVTAYTLDASTPRNRDLPPIGKPISNVGIYILDEKDQPVPVGVWGELCIDGPSGFAGYANKPDLIACKLLPAPAASGNKRELYRSGDIGRWLADGNIELKGRKDLQVKIQGFRVEPGEIESKILSIDGIRECVVTVREDASRQGYLAAYMVAKDKIEVDEVRRLLTRDMPQYMIPRLMVLESLPLLPNGKVDREKLPELEFHQEEKYTAPRNETEARLAQIWSGLLAIEPGSISVDANFFELGGHSLKATKMMTEIHKTFHVRIPLSDIFQSPVIKDLAGFITRAAEDRYASIEPVEDKEYYELSSAQKRLYYLQQVELQSTAYNMPYIEILDQNTASDGVELEQTFIKVIRRHESLRTSFHMVEGNPVQRVQETVDFEMDYHDLAAESIFHHFVRPFDLSQAPLIRAGFINTGDHKHVLIVDLHHIVSDGISHLVLVNDFLALYRSEELPLLRLQYKDFSGWQNREKNKDTVKAQEEYWKQQFDGEIPILNLPLDYPRPEIQQFAGDSIAFEFCKEETGVLNRLVLEEGVTLYMVLLALYALLLSRITGQEDIVAGTPIGGRRHADLYQIIGMFVNTLPIRLRLLPGKTFKEFLKRVKETTVEAFENQDCQFEDIVEWVMGTRDVSRNPLFDVMFALQGTDIQVPARGTSNLGASPSRDSEPLIFNNLEAKFDLTLTAIEAGKDESLSFTLDYNARLFKPETVERFVSYFKEIATTVMENPMIRLEDIKISHDFFNEDLQVPRMEIDF
jgi:tyrocidine synthetase-3